MAAELGGKKADELIFLKYLEDSLRWKEKKNYSVWFQWGRIRTVGVSFYTCSSGDLRYIKPSSMLIMFVIILVLNNENSEMES